MKIRNIRDIAAEVMTKPDQEGLIVRNVINKDDAGGPQDHLALLGASARQGAPAAPAPPRRADHVCAGGLVPDPVPR